MTQQSNEQPQANHFDISRATARIAEDQEIIGLIGSAVEQTVTQYNSMLRQGLEQEVKRIVGEFENATSDIEEAIIRRVKARLMDIVQEEVRKVFDEALSNAETSINPSRGVPGNGISRTGMGSPFSNLGETNPFYQNGAGDQSDPEGDDDRGGGGSFVHRPQPPQSPPTISARVDESDHNSHVQSDTPSSSTERTITDDGSQFTNWNQEPLDEDQIEIADADLEEDEMYEGTVRVNVEANDCIRDMVEFVRELRQKPQLRLLRLVGNNKEGVDIWLALREPVDLRKMLPEIHGVSVIPTTIPTSATNAERLLSVRLMRDSATDANSPDKQMDALPPTSQVLV